MPPGPFRPPRAMSDSCGRDDEWPAGETARPPADGSPPRVVFRRLRRDDVAQCFPAAGRAIAEEWLARQDRGELTIAVAEVDGLPVGRRCLDFTCYPQLHVGYCFAATVRPEWRSRGIGSLL